MSAAALDLSPLVAPVGTLILYNPHKESVFGSYNGETYEVPPGVAEVKAKRPMTPLILLKHFCGDDGRSGKLSDIGVRPLYGDPEKDAPIIAEADQIHEDWFFNQALGMKLAHMARIAREKEAGVPLTVPDARTRAAMQYVLEVEKKRGELGAFTCPHCAWPVATEADLNYHVLNFHPDLFDATKKNAAQAVQVQKDAPLNPAQRLGAEVSGREMRVAGDKAQFPEPLKPGKRGKQKSWKEHA